MSAYLQRLRKIESDKFINTPYIELKKPTEVPFGSNVGSVMGHIEKNNSDTGVINHWWLLHFKDSAPKQVCTWPHSNKAEMLALNPLAIEAEAILSPIDST